MKKIILKLLYNLFALCSRNYLKKTNPFIIWITWSVWKTSCRVVINETLKKLIKDKRVYSSPKNFNSEIWLTFSIFQIEKYEPSIINLLKKTLLIIYKSIFSKPDYDIIVLEYWIDYKYMDLLLKNAIPDIAIFIKLDAVHLENFNSIEEIWKEKFKLIHAAKKKVYLNYLDDYSKKQFENIKNDKCYFSYLDINANNYKIKLQKNNFVSSFIYKNTKIKNNLIWEENIAYIPLALNIYEYITKKEIKISEIELNYKLQAWRFSFFEWINDSILIDSTYNASPSSMQSMIKNTFKIKDYLEKNYKIWFVLWDMRELWEEKTPKEHKKLYELVKNSDFVFTVWKEMKKYLNPKLEENKYKWVIKSEIDSAVLWKRLEKFLNKNNNEKYLILFKWSQNTIFLENCIKEVLRDKSDIKRLVRQY